MQPMVKSGPALVVLDAANIAMRHGKGPKARFSSKVLFLVDAKLHTIGGE